MNGSNKTDYLQRVADKRFNGDREKAREFFKSKGRKGGETGVKHFSAVDNKTVKGYANKSHEQRRQNKKEKTDTL